MRIGFISTFPPIECGIATYTQYLTDALRQQHHDVYIVSHLGGSGRQVFPSFDYEDPDLYDKAFSVMVRLTPDVVHIQHEFGLFGKNYGVSVVPLILNFRLAGIPVVTTLHTVYNEISEPHKLILNAILLNSSRVIVHEEYQRETLVREFPQYSDSKIHVIPHGARELEPIPDAKARIGLPVKQKVVMMIGYFRPSKNFDLIIDLFPRIVERYPDAILVIAGKIRGKEYLDYRKNLFEKINRSPAREKIFVIRGQMPQETFDTVLSAADVVVLPYQISSQSGILAHCLAFGKPVVTSNTTAMTKLLERSHSGLVCHSEQEYVENIVRILSDEALAKQFSENARNYVRTTIGWSHVARRHVEIYQSITYTPELGDRIIWTD